ncbi:MAG: hypothetical protein ACAI44_02875 [Candidatus Sericytochromatia bacterium]
MTSFACQLLVSPWLDNSRFYLGWLQELGIAEIVISPLPAEDLPVAWYPLILFASAPAQVRCLPDAYAFAEQSWRVLDPVQTFANRVLPESLTGGQGLQIFSQPGCFACQTLMRKFKRQGAEFEALNERSALWHRLGVRRTPAFLWQGQYFFEQPQGLVLTPLARFLPSAGL